MTMLKTLLSLLVTLPIILPTLVCSFRLYKPREVVMNLLVPNGGAAEERLYMDRCEHSSNDGKCYRALDGEPIREWSQCTATQALSEPEWTGFLETPAYIIRIILHTLELPHSNMRSAFTSFELQVNDVPCYTYNSTRFFEVRSFPCDAFGDTVTVQSLVKKAHLALCEIELYGVPVRFQGLERQPWEVKSVACDPSLEAESDNRDCENAIDDIFTQKDVPGEKTCFRSANGEDPYFAAYLSVPALVTHVKLFLSLAHVNEMDKLEVQVNLNPCDIDTSEDLKDQVGKLIRTGYKRPDQPIYNCGSKFGSYIQVTNNKNGAHLTLCQVQVFGYKLIIGADSELNPLGCFKDKEDDPDLEMLVSTTNMTPIKCHRLCKRRNMPKFGLQNGQMCFCGAKHGKHGSSDDCNMVCKGSKRAKCGGRNSNSVYEIIS